MRRDRDLIVPSVVNFVESRFCRRFFRAGTESGTNVPLGFLGSSFLWLALHFDVRTLCLTFL